MDRVPHRVTRREFIAGSLAVTTAACRRPMVRRKPVALWLGGDVHLGAANGPALRDLDGVTAGAAGIVNLEGPIGDRPYEKREGDAVVLANAVGAARRLKEIGVRVAGIANNHDGDRGSAGAMRTVSELHRAGVEPAGGRAGHAVIALDGRTIVVTAHDLSGGVSEALSAQLGAAAKAAARTHGDSTLIATFHVTGPPSYLPQEPLRAAVDAAIASGARIIAAHGSHAIAPVERRHTSAGDILIAWGLGNLLFACDCTRESDAALLRVELDGNAIGATLIPIEAGLQGAAARPSRNAELALDLFEALGSSPLTRSGSEASF